MRWFGQRGALLCLVVVASTADLPDPEAIGPSVPSELPSAAGVALAPLTAHDPLVQEAASPRLNQHSDGAIDSFENDDFSGERLPPPSVRGAESCVAPGFHARVLASGQVLLAYPARGPPSA